MSKVRMYCTATCPYCLRAETLLEKRGATVEKIRVDLDPGLWDEMEKITGRDSVPQIFIGELHVGGYDDAIDLDMDDELVPLIEAVNA